MTDFFDPELELLGEDAPEDESTGSAHAYRTAPIFTGDALQALGFNTLPQRALYGRVLAQKAASFPIHPSNRKLYINTNAPFSALVCGVQGSGKSHSTSVLLESCLMKDTRLGTLPEPLSAIVFHFDAAAGGGCVQPCEAAYLSALDNVRGGDATPPSVTVLVLPTNLQAMKKVYAGLPNVKVEPLHFAPEDISGDRLLAMMKVDENSQMPLYMEAIMSILRSMEGNFNYTEFRKALKEQQFNPGQKAMLNLRLSLLDSCLEGGNTQNRASTHFRKGHLTIIDLSSSFMDGSSACGFFDLILGLFIEADVKASGKVVVLDEAHKYLSDSQSGTSSRLTDSLLSVIRQQRHLATRVIISTQEPTVVPSKFLDLCSFIIAHRFSSPKWLKLLADHVSAAESSFDELFAKIVSLRTGQAIMFAASGISVRESDTGSWHSEADSGVGSSDSDSIGAVAPIGQGYLHVQSRLRVTRDGGHSILAVNDPTDTTRLGRVPGNEKGQAQPEEAASSAEAPEAPQAKASSHTSAGGTSASAGKAAEAAAPPTHQPAPRAETKNPYVSSQPQPAKAAQSSQVKVENDTLAVILRPTPLISVVKLPPVQPSPSPPPPATDLKAPVTAAPETANSTKPSPGPTVFLLTGDMSKFRPLIAYLQERLAEGVNQVKLQTVRKHLGLDHYNIYEKNFEVILEGAVKHGLVQHVLTRTGKAKIKLNPNAEYRKDGVAKPVPPPSAPSPFVSLKAPILPAPASSTPAPTSSAVKSSPSTSSKPPGSMKVVHLTGNSAKFKLLVQYMQTQKQSGFEKINVQTIRKRFGPQIEDIIVNATSQGLVLTVPKSAKPKIMLDSHVQFVL